jgi:hypothetical protein
MPEGAVKPSVKQAENHRAPVNLSWALSAPARSPALDHRSFHTLETHLSSRISDEWVEWVSS